MTQEFVPYERARALKGLGFDEPTSFYWEDNIIRPLPMKDEIGAFHFNRHAHTENEWICAPTFSQAFKFFREKHNWQHSIEPTSDQQSGKLGYNYWIWNYKTGEEHYTMPKNRPSGDWEYEVYEQTELACLIKLIEIVKEKK